MLARDGRLLGVGDKEGEGDETADATADGLPQIIQLNSR